MKQKICFFLTILVWGSLAFLYPSKAFSFFNSLVTQKVAVSSNRGEVHFEIHGRPEDAALIGRVAEVLKHEARPLLEYFEYAPPHAVHFVLTPRASSANGSAQAFPFPLIHINTFPPLEYGHLVSADDWIQKIVLHELAHIADMDYSGGWVAGLRGLFGSVATLPTALAPRWFREGIAVWAEGQWNRGGRLRQDLARFEAHSRLLDEDFCSTLDCLDEPKNYPYLSTPYWIGGLFFEEQERAHPGLIVCLVKVHNSQFPFQISSAYRDCRGGRAELAAEFEQFIAAKRKQFVRTQKRGLSENFPGPWSPMRSWKFELGTPIWQKGFQVAQGKLLYVVDHRETPSGVLRDLKSGESILLNWKAHVDFISPAAQTAWPVSFSTGSRTLELRRPALLDLEKGHLKEEVELSEGADYPLQGKRTLYFFRYRGNSWQMHHYRKRDKGGREQLLWRMPPLASLTGADVSQLEGAEWVSFVLYDQKKKRPYQLWSVRGDGTHAQILYDSATPFRLMEQCENLLWIKEGGQLFQIRRLSALRVEKRRAHSPAGPIVQMRWDERDAVFLFEQDPTRMYHFPRGCTSVSRLLVQEKGLVENAIPRNISKEKKRDANRASFEDYPRISHFRPHWWFFDYSLESSDRKMGG